VAARLLHAPPPLAACGFTRGRKKIQATQGVCNGFIHSSFPVGGEEICHLQQKENAQTTMGFNRSLSLDRTILYLLSSSRFVSLCWWQIRSLARGPDLLHGVEPMKKSRLTRKGTICEFTRVWVADVFGLLRVGFSGDRSTPMMDCGQRWR
jgi:hypothetical protein